MKKKDTKHHVIRNDDAYTACGRRGTLPAMRVAFIDHRPKWVTDGEEIQKLRVLRPAEVCRICIRNTLA